MSWTENVSDEMSMKKIKIGDVGKVRGEIQNARLRSCTKNPEVMRSNKRYVATTCSHADHTSSCTVLAFLSGRAARS